jgi:AcrR family transcriptional regulator
VDVDVKKKDLTQSLYAQFFNFSPKKGDLRRVAIIEAALDCIAAQGIESLSFESLGQRLGMQRAHVAYYFPERDDIIEAAIKFVVSTAQTFTIEAIKEATNDRGRLQAYVSGAFDWLETFPKHGPTILLFYYYTCFNRKYRRMHDEVREMGAERLIGILKPIVPVAKHTALRPLAIRIQNLITGNLVYFTTTNTPMSLRELGERTLHDVEAALAGI